MESDKFKLGLFLILSFIIICFLFVVFGLFDFGTTKVQIVTLFEESVQGLEMGSTVQLRGVPVGKVKDITINMNDNKIRVDMEINIEKVRMQSLGGEVETEISEASFYQLMRKEISKGLCAQIQMNGITGGKSIGLDYAPKDEVPVGLAKPGFNKGGVFYMPSKPSTMIDMRNRLLVTLEKIASVDYRGLAARAESLLAAAEKVISNPNIEATLHNLNGLTDELNKSANALNGALTPERVEKLTVDAQESLAGMKILIEKLEKSVDAAKIGETSTAFRNAASTVTENKRVIRETLVRLGTALDRLSELLQTLEENPESIIRGKQ